MTAQNLLIWCLNRNGTKIAPRLLQRVPFSRRWRAWNSLHPGTAGVTCSRQKHAHWTHGIAVRVLCFTKGIQGPFVFFAAWKTAQSDSGPFHLALVVLSLFVWPQDSPTWHGNMKFIQSSLYLTPGSPPVIFCRLVCEPLLFFGRKQDGCFLIRGWLAGIQMSKSRKTSNLKKTNQPMMSWCLR